MILSRKRNNILLFVTLTLLLVAFWGWGYKKMISSIPMSPPLQQFYASEETDLAVCFSEEHVLEHKTDLFIKVWKQEEAGKYYLFVPYGFKDREAYWLKSGNEEICINGEIIENGAPFLLEEGEYELMISEGSVTTLEILYSSMINTMFVETESGLLDYIHQSKNIREKGQYVIIDSDGYVQDRGDLAGFGGRGNASWEHTDKKSYKIILDIEKDLLGMSKNKQWILISNYYDESLIRNKVVLELAEKIGLQYTSQCQFVDLYINGEYRGNYLLTEKIEIDEEHINIRDLEKEIIKINSLDVNKGFETIAVDEYMRLKTAKGIKVEKLPQDISGGYLLELEWEARYGEELCGFITSRGQNVIVKSPEYAPIESVLYVAERYQDFEDAIYSVDGYSPYTNKKYTDYIDMESFAKKYLLEEVAKNYDAAVTSQYFYKPADSVSTKFFAGPAWDYDKALGAFEGVNILGLEFHIPEGIHAGIQQFESDIWYGLCQQEEFMNYVYDEFEKEMRPAVEKIVGNIPELANTLEKSAVMDYVRWNVFEDSGMEKKDEYYREVAFVMNFLVKRIQFLQQEWNNE